MRRSDMRGWRPHPRQELLLRVALGSGEEVPAAWREWLRDADFSSLDLGSARLLPLAWENLRAHGLDPLPPPLAEAAAAAWLENQLRLQDTADLVSFLRAAGIDTLVLKGVALALLHYRDAALRPMTDVDLLIPQECAAAAIALLAERGWKSTRQWPESYIRYHHAIELIGPGGGRCDLHWRSLWDVPQQIGDADLWASAVPLDLAGIATLALNPSDQLLHICAHGAVWNEMPTVRWVADAAVILRGSTIDWTRLVEQSRKRGLVLPMTDTLRYLRDVMHLPIPADALRALETTSVSRGQRLLYRIRSGPGETLRPLPLILSWIEGWRASPEPFPRKAAELGRHWQSLWYMRSVWHAPYHILVRCIRRLAAAPQARASELLGSSEFLGSSGSSDSRSNRPSTRGTPRNPEEPRN